MRWAPIRHLDPVLLVTACLLAGFGVLMVYSASAPRAQFDGPAARQLLDRQLVFAAVGVTAMIVVSAFSYRRLRAWGPIGYGACLALLALVLTPLGTRAAGAQRWISFGFFQLQPSELMKVAVVAVLAALLADGRGEPGLREVLRVAAVVALPSLFIFVQPDLGTLLVLVAVVFGMLLIAGTRLRVLALILLLGVGSFFALSQVGLIQEYQQARLTAFLDPARDPERTGYNLEQAMIAVGSGQVTGRGLFAGTQTNLYFLPEVHTDFIFAAVGEQLGFVGSALLLGLFGLFFWRGLRIAILSKDPFGTLLAAGIVTMLAFQVFVNIGMTVGLSPITGIPLPFVSYGGSSLLTTFLATGILLNIHMRRGI